MQEKVEDESLPWKGCSMDEIYRCLNPFELSHISPIKPSRDHSVLYEFPITNTIINPPKPLKGNDKWDAYHVRLPTSSKCQCPVLQEDGSSTIESRWDMIGKALLQPIKSSLELEKAILIYNSKYKNSWKFNSLHTFFEEMEEDEATIFFDNLLPKMIRLALRLPDLIQSSIPLLKQGYNKSISLSQQQTACLLANAFFCTYPRRNTTKRKSEYSSFPDINFNRLFQSSGSQVIEKLKCIFHYFKRVCNDTPLGVLTFTRRSIPLSDLPNWLESNAPVGVTPLHITSVGTIEDQGDGLLQVDFANKFLGGGVLGSGCVQEEIRFVICPELLISKLFTECLKPNEALLMVGAERFSNYSGYASTFIWDGNVEDCTPLDESNRKQCHIVAIDALHFTHSSHQYREELILRELNKAFVGFNHTLSSVAPGIASGNWGCGAFGGEPTLKALIQLMACTLTKRPLVYFTFGNQQLRDEIHQIHTFFIEENVSVKQLFLYLKTFGSQKNMKVKSLLDYIRKKHKEKDNRFMKFLTGPNKNDNASKLDGDKIEQSKTKNSEAKINLQKKNKNSLPETLDVGENSKLNVTEKQEKPIKLSDIKNDSLNESQDLFGSDSSEENNDVSLIKDKKPTLSQEKNKKITAKSLSLSLSLSNEEQPCTSSKANSETQKKYRQKSLLEMLDSDYVKNCESPSAKRHCAESN